MTKLLHADLTYKLRGLAFRVHRELCGGHEERVYDTAYALALEAARIPFSSSRSIALTIVDNKSVSIDLTSCWRKGATYLTQSGVQDPPAPQGAGDLLPGRH